MKTRLRKKISAAVFTVIIFLFCIVLFAFSGDRGAGTDNPAPVQTIRMQANNISVPFTTNGIMCGGSNYLTIWPASSSSMRTVNYVAGLWVGAKVVLAGNQKELRLAAAWFGSHYSPGNIPVVGGVPPQSVCDDPKWRGYFVQLTDPALINGGIRLKTAGGVHFTFNFDPWSLWPVQLGAPYVEVNGVPGYQPGWNADRPGIGNSDARPDELLFMVYMDYTNCTNNIHAVQTGLPGGSLPLGVEIHQLSFMFDGPPLANMYFVKFKVINKSSKQWDSTYIAYTDDIDIGAGSGSSTDDAVGCDTARDIGFIYNADNDDYQQGPNPPAMGYSLLQGPLKYTGNYFDTAKLPYDTLVRYKIIGLSTFSMFINGAPDPCLIDPDNHIKGYNFMRGMDGCGRARLNPLTGQPTLFCYTGDACNRVGWFDSASHDVRLLMGSGPIVMNSLDTQIILLAGVVGYGSNNFQNVCNMLNASESARRYYYDNFNYSVSGQVRYRDNNQPVRSGYVKALKYDVNLGNIIAIDSVSIDSSGNYTLRKCPVDSLDIMAYQNSEEDFVPTYYVSTIDWRNAVKVYPDGNLQNINILVYRIQTGPELDPRSRIGGRVFNLNEQGLKDAIVYAKRGSSFMSYGISTSTGNYVINSLEFGVYDILVNRMGNCGASSTIILGPNNIDTLNFRLCRVLIGIEKNGEIIPQSFKLNQNYPNPFNPKTRIEFDIPVNSMVTLVVYDLLGREVTKLLDNDFKLSGSYRVELDASGFSSGVYFYRFEARQAALLSVDFTETKKMVLIK